MTLGDLISSGVFYLIGLAIIELAYGNQATPSKEDTNGQNL
jgi:hypothetical protein